MTSAKRERPGSGFSRRILSVLMGASSENSRAIESQKLLNYGFQNFDAVQLYKKAEAVGSYPVWKGQQPEIKAGFAEDVMVTVPKAQATAVRKAFATWKATGMGLEFTEVDQLSEADRAEIARLLRQDDEGSSR